MSATETGDTELGLAEVAADTTKDDSSMKHDDENGKSKLLSVSSLIRWCRILLLPCIGEVFGTFLLTLFICTAVASAVLTGAQQGIWQVAFPSGLGVAISIYISAHISDAHLNPAVTVAFGIVRFRQFHWSKILPYVVAQVLGGVLAGVFVFAVFHSAIDVFEERQDIVRGENGSQFSAMMFGEYFPNPAVFSHDDDTNLEVVSLGQAFFIEAWGTGILAFIIFAATNPRNTLTNKNNAVIPIVIGLTVGLLINYYGPLTEAGLNPARDFGPRLVAAMAGWGRIAFPGPRNGFWVYILGPLIGGPIGAALSDALVWFVDKFKVQKEN